MEKKSSDIFVPDNTSDNEGSSGGNGTVSDINIDEEAPLIPSRLSHIGRTQLMNHAIGKWKPKYKVHFREHFWKKNLLKE